MILNCFYGASTVVQLYMEEAVLASKAIEMHTDDPRSVTHIVHQPTKETTQFFSPSTKAVLEEIADLVELKVDTCIQPPHFKRTLMFGSIPTTISTATSEKGIVDIPPMVHEVESPNEVQRRENKRQIKSWCMFSNS